MNFNRDRLLRAGAELRRLVNAEGFDTALEVLRDQYKEMLFQTTPGDEGERERLYRQYHALDDLLGIINTLVYASEQDRLNTEIEE